MDPVRILFVDDEPNIRLTLPKILELHGFEVTTKATVAEALKALNEFPYDVLLADLNIGEPGDGFTVVSAMRRTHPQAVTIILTGYPAFETALLAIRNQVDDYAVKPADIDELVRAIRSNLERRGPPRPLATKTLGQVLRENQSRILSSWLELVKADAQLSAVPMSDDDRTAYLLRMLVNLCEFLDAGLAPGAHSSTRSAGDFARQRRDKGYTAAMLLREICLIRKVLHATMQSHLLALDMSQAFPDMIQVDEYIDRQLELLMESFLQA